MKNLGVNQYYMYLGQLSSTVFIFKEDLTCSIKHDQLLQYIVFQIFLLLFLMLYFGSYVIISRFRRRDKEDLFSTDEDEIIVYRIRYY